MKTVLTSFFICCLTIANGQATLPQPVEERHPVNYWWWIIGVAIVIGLGILAYMLIKKDPRKDAV